MSGVSVYSFKNGIGTLTDALVNALKAIPNVTLKLNTRILQIRPRLESKGVTVSAAKCSPAKITCHSTSGFTADLTFTDVLAL